MYISISAFGEYIIHFKTNESMQRTSEHCYEFCEFLEMFESISPVYCAHYSV